VEVIEHFSGVYKKVRSILFSAFYRVSFPFDLVFKEAIAILRVDYFFDFLFLIGIFFVKLFILD
jgi:hypothetical protein